MKKILPVYYNKKSPCYSEDHLGQTGCPAHSDIARFVYSIRLGRPKEAFEILKTTNPFSGGCGRFCDHPCERACNRAKFDEAVDIKSLERFASDYGLKNNILGTPVTERKNKSIAIIGSGPAGLSTAYFLSKAGYDTTIYERHAEPGGILREGIPTFRYPVDVRAYELNYIKSFGVEIKTNVQIDSPLLLQILQEYDAVVVATGSQKSRKMNIPGDDLPGVKVGFEFLRNLQFDPDFMQESYSGLLDKLGIGKNIAVIGGGYTAFDVARSAVRLGGNPMLFYRRTVSEMTAHPGEVEEAEHEGVTFEFLSAPVSIVKLDNGQLKMRIQKMKLGEIDNSGRCRPEPIHGSEHTLIVDTIITAIGETPELEFIPDDYKIDGLKLLISSLDESTQKKLFITGDALQGHYPATGMVVRAVGIAQKTVLEIRSFFGEDIDKEDFTKNIAFYRSIKTRYFSKQAKAHVNQISYDKRKNNFLEIEQTLPEEVAMDKAARCWNCGICIQCDWCRDYANDAILKLSIPWNKEKNSHFYKFIKENVTRKTEESVTGCPRNAMALVPYDDTHQALIDEQYISYESIKY